MAYVTVIVGPRGSGKSSTARSKMIRDESDGRSAVLIDDYGFRPDRAFVSDGSNWMKSRRTLEKISLDPIASESLVGKAFQHVYITAPELTDELRAIAHFIIRCELGPKNTFVLPDNLKSKE